MCCIMPLLLLILYNYSLITLPGIQDYFNEVKLIRNYYLVTLEMACELIWNQAILIRDCVRDP